MSKLENVIPMGRGGFRLANVARIKNGTEVTVRDENGERVTGTVHSYGQANDGTGRLGYHVQVGEALYWRAESAVEVTS